MTFSLACGDVMPGCAARFSAGSRDELMSQVAQHAAAEHGMIEITPRVSEAIESQIIAA